MKELLVVIDMQNDFVTGSLGTKEACAITEKVRQKILSWTAREERLSLPVIPTGRIILKPRKGENFRSHIASGVVKDGRLFHSFSRLPGTAGFLTSRRLEVWSLQSISGMADTKQWR